MAFKMKAGPEGPMVKNYGSAFEHKGCSKHKHPHSREYERTSGCSKKDKKKKILGGVAKVGAVISMLWGAKKKMDNA